MPELSARGSNHEFPVVANIFFNFFVHGRGLAVEGRDRCLVVLWHLISGHLQGAARCVGRADLKDDGNARRSVPSKEVEQPCWLRILSFDDIVHIGTDDTAGLALGQVDNQR